MVSNWYNKQHNQNFVLENCGNYYTFSILSALIFVTKYHPVHSYAVYTLI